MAETEIGFDGPSLAEGEMGKNFTAAEIEFLAEDELVVIIPGFHGPLVECIAGNYGPFAPMRPVEVPVWLAMALKQRGRCTIQPPAWLAADVLQRKFEQEQISQNEKVFEPMPFHYQELANTLTRSDPDFPNAKDVNQRLKDIESIREAKLEAGLKALNAEQIAIKLNNVSAMEINAVRPFFSQVMGQFYRLKTHLQEEDAGGFDMEDTDATLTL